MPTSNRVVTFQVVTADNRPIHLDVMKGFLIGLRGTLPKRTTVTAEPVDPNGKEESAVWNVTVHKSLQGAEINDFIRSIGLEGLVYLRLL